MTRKTITQPAAIRAESPLELASERVRALLEAAKAQGYLQAAEDLNEARAEVVRLQAKLAAITDAAMQRGPSSAVRLRAVLEIVDPLPHQGETHHEHLVQP